MNLQSLPSFTKDSNDLKVVAQNGIPHKSVLRAFKNSHSTTVEFNNVKKYVIFIELLLYIKGHTSHWGNKRQVTYHTAGREIQGL